VRSNALHVQKICAEKNAERPNDLFGAALYSAAKKTALCLRLRLRSEFPTVRTEETQ